MTTSNNFTKDLLNPIWIISIIVLLFVSLITATLLAFAMLIYTMWRSNILIIKEDQLIVSYPNWKFSNIEKRYNLSNINRIDVSPHDRGAYAGLPFLDIYMKNKDKVRNTYSPSLSKEELNRILDLLKSKLGSDNVNIIN